MRHGSLFSGIGGFDLAAEWMGWQNVFHCEWNPFGQKVLHHYWPNAEQFTDITKSDFTKYANTIDILTGGFHASHTQWQEKDLEKKMRDISGLRCLEQFGKFSRHGLWGRMFSDLLIGMEGWSSMRCRLTWKLKGTRYNRMYFQLHPSMHHTGETECGLLPTVTAMDSTNATANMKSTQVKEGSMHFVTLVRAMSMGMLPTPRQSEWKGVGQLGSKSQVHMEKKKYLCAIIQSTIGQSGQLSPQFVMEMMGFPPDWTLLPFQSGEQNQSKPEEMP